MKRNKRNKEATKADLINAVIADIAEHGFKGLSGAKLAEKVGRHGSRITDLFGGLNGLVKAAVAERDHWAHLFNKFSIPKKARAWQINSLFAGLMSKNLSSFKENVDMQHMIQGQVSVEHEVLREISEYREREGGKMLARTDGHFENSGVCFRTIIGLLLYGSYGLVLHARYTGGTVAGKDINTEQDLITAQKMIVYLIGLAWEDGGLKRKRVAREMKKKKKLNLK